MKKILIIYICTGHYIEQFYDIFINNIENFCPNYKKHICILTDKLIDIEIKNDNITYDVHNIEFLPWPITTMIKHVYIYKYAKQYQNKFDYLCYVNANAKALPKSDVFWENFYDDLDNYDVLLSKFHWNIENISDPSYILGGFIIGKFSNTLKICEQIGKMECDSLNNFTIPKCHDETIVNDYFKNVNSEFKYKHENYLIDGGQYDKKYENKFPLIFLTCYHKSKDIKFNYMEYL